MRWQTCAPLLDVEMQIMRYMYTELALRAQLDILVPCGRLLRLQSLLKSFT